MDRLFLTIAAIITFVAIAFAQTDSYPHETRAGLTGPALEMESIDVSSTDDTPDKVCRAVLIGTAGDLTLQLRDDSSSSTATLGQGIHSLRAKKFFNSGSTASGIFCLR